MQSYTFDFTGAEDGPRYTDAYKRAVYKQPPRNFAVQVLPPQKFGHSYSYGMLISPFKDGNDRHSIISRSSGSSGSSNESRASTTVLSMMDTSSTAPLPAEYEVWRRWEDCLYFQDILENEYARMSREKRARLQAGKGVKKNGMYAHQDPTKRLHHAASFESLPPGPDPNMIAKDVHEILPRLTKKGALFKASKDMIEQRGSEFKALVETLLREENDVPMLIQELRQLRVVRDFFGFWRRDKDRIEKQFGRLPENSEKFSLRERSESVGSRASSVFSSSGGMGIYFNPSNLSLQLPSPDQPTTNKSPRRPAFMQGGKGTMTLVPSSPNEAGPSKEPATPRRRAQTLQGTSSTASGLVNEIRADLQDPPASAPATATFAEAMDNEYTSDSVSVASSGMPSSPQARPVSSSAHRAVSPTRSPRVVRPTRSPREQMELRYSDIFLADEADGTAKNIVEDTSDPIIVNMEDLPFEEDMRTFSGREHGRFLSQSIDARMGGLQRLQDLTIKEEDEQELINEQNEMQYGYALYDSQPSGSSSNGHETGESVGQFSELSSYETDDRTISDVERPKSPAWSHSSNVSSARVAAARREALRSLTGGDNAAPVADSNSVQLETPSARSSILTVTSGSGSGSGSSSASTNSGRVHSSDTHSSVDSGRLSSFRSSIASCEDIDRTLSSSPVTLHSPSILEEFTAYDADSGYPTDRRQSTTTSSSASGYYRPHDSMSSVQTFMTETSVDVVLPHRSPHQLRPTSPRSSAGMVQAANMIDEEKRDNVVELRDSYFFGLSTDAKGPLQDGFDDPAHGFPAGGLTGPSRVQQRSMSPELSTSPKPTVRATSPISPVMRSVSPSPSATTYAPSIVASFSEESGLNAVSIKAIYGEHIIAFRIDRNSSLGEVREKLRHKLVDQQGVSLSEKFSVAYKPPGPGRVQELRRAFGRSRSSSVSSVGVTNPNSLRILFSQRDWTETVGSCPPGAKVTLHVLNG